MGKDRIGKERVDWIRSENVYKICKKNRLVRPKSIERQGKADSHPGKDRQNR